MLVPIQVASTQAYKNPYMKNDKQKPFEETFGTYPVLSCADFAQLS